MASLYLWSEILFHGDAPAEPENAIYDNKTDDLPPRMTSFYIVIITILMHFFTFSPFKKYMYSQRAFGAKMTSY